MPAVNINPTDSILTDEPEIEPEVPEVSKEDTYESLVGRVELMNLKKIELGINLDEPVHISKAEYIPSQK